MDKFCKDNGLNMIKISDSQLIVMNDENYEKINNLMMYSNYIFVIIPKLMFIDEIKRIYSIIISDTGTNWILNETNHGSKHPMIHMNNINYDIGTVDSTNFQKHDQNELITWDIFDHKCCNCLNYEKQIWICQKCKYFLRKNDDKVACMCGIRQNSLTKLFCLNCGYTQNAELKNNINYDKNDIETLELICIGLHKWQFKYPNKKHLTENTFNRLFKTIGMLSQTSDATTLKKNAGNAFPYNKAEIVDILRLISVLSDVSGDVVNLIQKFIK